MQEKLPLKHFQAPAFYLQEGHLDFLLDQNVASSFAKPRIWFKNLSPYELTIL